MADEPKKVRKRAVKKSSTKSAADAPTTEAPAKEKKSKASGAIPAPTFQAAVLVIIGSILILDLLSLSKKESL